MKKFSTIYKANILLFVALNVMVYSSLLSKGGSDSTVMIAVFGLVGLAIQLLFNLIAAIVCFATGKKTDGQHFILSAILVLVIGLGVCGLMVGVSDF